LVKQQLLEQQVQERVLVLARVQVRAGPVQVQELVRVRQGQQAQQRV
jgi:hypothetical protein